MGIEYIFITYTYIFKYRCINFYKNITQQNAIRKIRKMQEEF